ncbi:MAG: mannose-6-phosphate isomerase, partial [Acidobacteriia bacterium]|nr:mannose-6-phosphate isomerase [Terriglobia bacterium]
MPTLDTPLQISNVYKPKIWGRKDLSPLFEKPPEYGGSELIGEVWITDDAGCFLNGPPAGLKLAEASRKYGEELHGKNWKGPAFPLLAKYIFTSDWLSVQVHPDDDYA